VVTVNLKDNPTVTVLVMVEAGSKYETKEQNGVSHFLEHMCFKGTKTRPKPIDIVRELDGIGSQYNAFTSQEFTGYYAKSDPKHVGKILDVVTDLYLNPTLPEKELEKEKGVIVDEISMYEDLPMQEVHTVFEDLLYGDQPAGWKITGTKETVRAMTRDNLKRYRDSHYVPEATVVVVAGNFDEVAAAAAVADKFGGISMSPKSGKVKVVEKQSGPMVKIKHKKTDQTHIVLGVRTYDAYDERNTALKTLGVALGGGMSSRLFQKLRDEMGIGYYVQASVDASTDHGYFYVSIGTDKNRARTAVAAIMEEFVKIKNDPVPDHELQKAKEYMIGNMYLGLETSDSIAEYYGLREVLKKDLITPYDLAEKIRKVTADDIKNIANEIFTRDKINLAMIGELDDTNEYMKEISNI